MLTKPYRTFVLKYSISVSTGYKSSSTPLHHLNFVLTCFGVGTPNGRAVLQVGSDQSKGD